MFQAWVMRASARLVIAALLAMANSASAQPQSADEIDTLNRQVEQLFAQGDYADAATIAELALTLAEGSLGGEHPSTLESINNLAMLRMSQDRYGEADSLHKRALEGLQRVLGAEHSNTLTTINNLAALYFAQGDWALATVLLRRSTTTLAKRSLLGTPEALEGKKKSEAAQSDLQFWRLVKAVNRLTEGREAVADASREMFQTAQWALDSEAAQSLAQMAARGSKADPELAKVVRERQDMVAEWQRRDALRSGSLAETPDKRSAKAEAENAARLAAIYARVVEIDRWLAAGFPEYAALVSPEPISIEAVQAQLDVDEALVLFLDTPEWKPTPEETFIWVVTKIDARWVRSDLGKAALAREVQALRCGLDEEEWATPTKSGRCATLLDLAEQPNSSQPLPFHLGKAHALYRALFGQVERMIAGKRLLIVPSGALTSLPFHVLVAKAPGTPLPDTFDGYRDVAWLGRDNAITTLPAVSSLKALRQLTPNREAASEGYAGYGDPRLSGDASFCRSAKTRLACKGIEVSVDQIAERATIRGRGGQAQWQCQHGQYLPKGSTREALVAQVRGLCPLPDTAHEIKCVAEGFAAKAPLIRLAGEATETHIKTLSESGKLARYRVLHFATHGLLSGDVEVMAKRQGEPALVLTPPDKPANDEDDGLLMASEVAALKLNADWVVLSACNTAGGDRIGAQALSGLARAFFYAGGRALLVSHWPVYSDAAVRLTMSAFAELERNPKASRAEALQRAMTDLMDDRSQVDNAHPAVWAPFVVVGDGPR